VKVPTGEDSDERRSAGSKERSTFNVQLPTLNVVFVARAEEL
jgi:hypothetical protein